MAAARKNLHLSPCTEAYELMMRQIRRATASIPSNLIKGCAHGVDDELARFCNNARGSASELQYRLLLTRDLKLIQPNDYEQLAQKTIQIKRIRTVFAWKLKAEG
jgi:four helix bundle protein